MEQRVKNLENLMEQVVSTLNNLDSSATLPPQVEATIRNRIMGVATITTAEGTVNFDASGVGLFSVTKAPAGFFSLTDSNGVKRNIAYYEI